MKDFSSFPLFMKCMHTVIPPSTGNFTHTHKCWLSEIKIRIVLLQPGCP